MQLPLALSISHTLLNIVVCKRKDRDRGKRGPAEELSISKLVWKIFARMPYPIYLQPSRSETSLPEPGVSNMANRSCKRVGRFCGVYRTLTECEVERLDPSPDAGGAPAGPVVGSTSNINS